MVVAFINGHGSAELYTPEHIVEQYDVIVITFNYRLGALGFLDWSYFNAHYDKNNGLSDQIAVLKWVAHFIKYFGGDLTMLHYGVNQQAYEYSSIDAATTT